MSSLLAGTPLSTITNIVSLLLSRFPFGLFWSSDFSLTLTLTLTHTHIFTCRCARPHKCLSLLCFISDLSYHFFVCVFVCSSLVVSSFSYSKAVVFKEKGLMKKCTRCIEDNFAEVRNSIRISHFPSLYICIRLMVLSLFPFPFTLAGVTAEAVSPIYDRTASPSLSPQQSSQCIRD